MRQVRGETTFCSYSGILFIMSNDTAMCDLTYSDKKQKNLKCGLVIGETGHWSYRVTYNPVPTTPITHARFHSTTPLAINTHKQCAELSVISLKFRTLAHSIPVNCILLSFKFPKCILPMHYILFTHLHCEYGHCTLTANTVTAPSTPSEFTPLFPCCRFTYIANSLY